MSPTTNTASLRRPLASFIVVALLAAIAVAIPAFTRPANAACKMTPEGQVLVMSDNVYETDKQDAANTRDLKKFVRRMKKLSPEGFAPDIALVQEGRKKSFKSIARFMSRRFGCKYAIDRRATASKSGWQWINKYWKLGGQDTGVIYNTNSMTLRSAGQIVHDYNREDAAPRESVKVKKTAWSKVLEKNQPNELAVPLTVVAASVHFPRGSDFDGDALNQELKREFSEDIANSLEREQPDALPADGVIHVIAGDFNMSRHKGSPANPMPPYRVLTSGAYGYTDGPIDHATGAPNPIDFLFSTGRALKAGMDSNNTHDESAKSFYSNHDLRWSLLSE